jgi:exonuclease SbcC
MVQTAEQVRQASEATELVAKHQADHDGYVAAQVQVADLEPKLLARKEQEEQRLALTGQQAKFAALLDTLKQQLTDLAAAEKERKALQPDLDRWLALEQEGTTLAEAERLRRTDLDAQTRTTAQLATIQQRLAQTEQELAALGPLTATATALPERQQAVAAGQSALQQMLERQAVRQATALQIQTVEKTLAERHEQLLALQTETSRLTAQAPAAATLPVRQAALAEQQHAVGAAKARAASLEEWQGRLAGGTCPFLAAKCLNLADGQSLDQALGVTLTEAQGAIVTATAAVAGLQAQVAEAQQAATLTASLPDLERRQTELQTGITGLQAEADQAKAQLQTLDQALMGLDGARQALALAEAALAEAQAAAVAAAKADGVRTLGEELRQQVAALEQELTAVQQRLAAVTDLDARLADHKAQLAALTDPRPKAHSLDAKIAERPELAKRIVKGETMLADVTVAMTAVLASLAETEGLITAMTVAKELLDRHHAGYQVVLQYKVLAASLPAVREDEATLTTGYSEATAALATQQQALIEHTAAYDAAAHTTSRLRLTELTAEVERLGERARHLEAQVTELQARIRQLEDVQVQSEEWLKQQTELDRITEFLETGRSALRDAGPRLTQAYLASISTEANRLYREVTGQGWVDLRWADDYEIVLTEGGLDRPFANLSGGEQMAAALSVRLALLKEVSSLDIAFFDEPTTNLDEERRRNLAKQLPQVKGFRQLFVISHDDSFEEVTDHVVRVDEATERVPG